MFDRTNRFLLAAGVLTLVLCGLSFSVDVRLLLFLPALPAFCFQYLVLRMTSDRVLRLLPLFLLALWAGVGWLILTLATGWDGLLGVLMLFTSIAPAVGLAAAGLFFFLRRRKE